MGFRICFLIICSVQVFIYKSYSPKYKSVCAGNIISENKVLSSAHCFLTHRKRYIHNLKGLSVVAATLTLELDVKDESVQQWRSIKSLYSQKYYRFPAYSLAVLIVDKNWIFNDNVAFIPLATKNSNYDGICLAASVRTESAWKDELITFKEPMTMMKRNWCEMTLQRSCYLFYCTTYEKGEVLAAKEYEGSGLICHGTGDPAEKDRYQGVLVGVTTLINVVLPSLHNRVNLFNKWIKDFAITLSINKLLLISISLPSTWQQFYD